MTLAAVFPETAVKQPNGNYKCYFRDAMDEVTTTEMTPEQLAKMFDFSYETFGSGPNTKVIG